MEKISVDKMRFVDEYGRERIFAGMNVVDKKDFNAENPYFGYPANEFPFDDFRARGLDIIRLGFVWCAMEPKPGKYNEQLIESLAAFMDKCADYGIYVYLDCHQDCYGSYVYGDGAPKWATLVDGKKPLKQRFVWAEPYFIGAACHRAFDNFWNNRHYNSRGLQDFYANMWKKLVEAVKDKPALFGYDFFNEPFPGTAGNQFEIKFVKSIVKNTLTNKKISLTTMAKEALGKEKIKVLDQFNGEVSREIVSTNDETLRDFDENKYSPFIAKMTKAVREITDNGIIFNDNSYFSNLGLPCWDKPVEIDGKREPLQCFAPHGYDLMVDTPAYKYANNSRVGMIFDVHRQSQERLGVPCIVGEWGSQSDGDGWYPHIRYLLDKFDSYKWSNTYWSYYDGIFEKDFVKLLTRPHPKAVTGVISSYHYDFEKGKFTLSYNQEKEYEKPTVVYVPYKPKAINCKGTYTVTKLSEEAEYGYDIEFNTGIGENTITIEL